jgi:hypothetical protein
VPIRGWTTRYVRLSSTIVVSWSGAGLTSRGCVASFLGIIRCRGVAVGPALQIVWVSGLFDLNRKDLTDFKRPLTEYYNRFNRILDRGAFALQLPASVRWLPMRALASSGTRSSPPLAFPRSRPPPLPFFADAAGFHMIIFIPPQFEEHLHIDKSKHFVIHMNGALAARAAADCSELDGGWTAEAPSVRRRPKFWRPLHAGRTYVPGICCYGPHPVHDVSLRRVPPLSPPSTDRSLGAAHLLPVLGPAAGDPHV